MNTCISYEYRDAENYKTFKDVIIQGTLHLNEIKPYFHEEEFFIPSEVGLKDLQPESFTPVDHIWHCVNEISGTDAESGIAMTASILINKFKLAKESHWNEFEVFKKKGLL